MEASWKQLEGVICSSSLTVLKNASLKEHERRLSEGYCREVEQVQMDDPVHDYV